MTAFLDPPALNGLLHRLEALHASAEVHAGFHPIFDPSSP